MDFATILAGHAQCFQQTSFAKSLSELESKDIAGVLYCWSDGWEEWDGATPTAKCVYFDNIDNTCAFPKAKVRTSNNGLLNPTFTTKGITRRAIFYIELMKLNRALDEKKSMRISINAKSVKDLGLQEGDQLVVTRKGKGAKADMLITTTEGAEVKTVKGWLTALNAIESMPKDLRPNVSALFTQKAIFINIDVANCVYRD